MRVFCVYAQFEEIFTLQEARLFLEVSSQLAFHEKAIFIRVKLEAAGFFEQINSIASSLRKSVKVVMHKTAAQAYVKALLDVDSLESVALMYGWIYYNPFVALPDKKISKVLKKLDLLGFKTMDQFACLSGSEVLARFSFEGLALWNLLRLEQDPPWPIVSGGLRFYEEIEFDSFKLEQIDSIAWGMRSLVEKVLDKLKKIHLSARLITLHLVAGGEKFSAQCTLASQKNSVQDICQYFSSQLLQSFGRFAKPVFIDKMQCEVLEWTEQKFYQLDVWNPTKMQVKANRDAVVSALVRWEGPGCIFQANILSHSLLPENAWEAIEVCEGKTLRNAEPHSKTYFAKRPLRLFAEPFSAVMKQNKQLWLKSICYDIEKIEQVEKISTHWWDQKGPVNRLYCVVTCRRGNQKIAWWAYQQGNQWYVHGVF